MIALWLACAPRVSSEAGWASISAGGAHTCGIAPDGVAVCWGCEPAEGSEIDFRACDADPGPFDRVVAGYDGACGLDADGALTCWPVPEDLPEGPFTAVGVGEGGGCALAEDGSASCWGEIPSARGPFDALAVGRHHACGLNEGLPDCWGEAPGTPPAMELEALSAGSAGTCGIDALGSVVCWGDSPEAPENAAGTWTSVAVGGEHACLGAADGTVTCFGSDEFGQASVPRRARFESVSAGEAHTCGLREDGKVECWGDDTHGQATPR